MGYEHQQVAVFKGGGLISAGCLIQEGVSLECRCCIFLLHDTMHSIARSMLSRDIRLSVRPSVCRTPVLCQNC